MHVYIPYKFFFDKRKKKMYLLFRLTSFFLKPKMGNKTSGKGKKDPTVLNDEDIKVLKLNTHYTEEEIQAWHSGFLKDCPSGKLDKKQFLNVYKVDDLLKKNYSNFLY
jgi:hypothetical protein